MNEPINLNESVQHHATTFLHTIQTTLRETIKDLARDVAMDIEAELTEKLKRRMIGEMIDVIDSLENQYDSVVYELDGIKDAIEDMRKIIR